MMLLFLMNNKVLLGVRHCARCFTGSPPLILTRTCKVSIIPILEMIRRD